VNEGGDDLVGVGLEGVRRGMKPFASYVARADTFSAGGCGASDGNVDIRAVALIDFAQDASVVGGYGGDDITLT
jgi:hypothetical protein